MKYDKLTYLFVFFLAFALEIGGLFLIFENNTIALVFGILFINTASIMLTIMFLELIEEIVVEDEL